ncbi:UNVERIFIED_CONTAM: hypothetical protein GTU68_006246 [Idotea baltica]|nr:hypothetical protein [Idotea baltica]
MKRILVQIRSVTKIKSVKMPFYAVAKGKTTGIFTTWSECQEQIVGFKGPVFKKFNTEEEANSFIQERGSNTVDKRPAAKEKTESNDKPTEKVSSKDLLQTKKLSPALLQMHREMKLMQKQLSNLRTRFDEYVNNEINSSDSSENSLKRRSSDDVEDSNSSKKTKLTEDEKDKSKFELDSDGFLIVYTDGSCAFNGKHGAQAGVGVFFGDDHPMNVSEPVKGRATNNTAEIQAASYALELTKSAGFDKVILNTDSQFMINCATSWMPNWKKNDWKKRDGTEVVNKEDLIELDKASEGLLVKWNHIKGHDGVPGNEAADKLARQGAKRYQKED